MEAIPVPGSWPAHADEEDDNYNPNYDNSLNEDPVTTSRPPPPGTLDTANPSNRPREKEKSSSGSKLKLFKRKPVPPETHEVDTRPR